MARYEVSSDQLGEIDRQLSEIRRLVNRRSGSPLDPDAVSRGLQVIIDERTKPAVKGATTSPKLAATIMGEEFHDADALRRHFGVRLYARDHPFLHRVPFSRQALEACQGTHVLFVGGGVSIMDIRRAVPDAFYFQKAWYEEEEFANRPVKTGWYLMRKDAVAGSTSKLWPEQHATMPDDEYTPTACELVLGVILHYLETRERLLSALYVRTDDLDSAGRRVSIGRFASQGLRVLSRGESLRDYYFGLAGALKSSWTRESLGQSAHATGRSQAG
jgi:hypothetical protein